VFQVGVWSPIGRLVEHMQQVVEPASEQNGEPCSLRLAA